MVEGLDRFREHFRDHTHQFVLIGGTACDLIMEEAGLEFRATRDLDIVLQMKLLEPAFFLSFWEFVRRGEYHIQQAESGRPRFYRFAAPEQPGYPSMLELFSVQPDVLTAPGKGHLTPIPAGGLVSSLSAILLDDTYYSFLKNGIRSIDAVPVVGQEHLLPLKVRAWLEMTTRKKNGERVDSRDIKKHRWVTSSEWYRKDVCLGSSINCDRANHLPHERWYGHDPEPRMARLCVTLLVALHTPDHAVDNDALVQDLLYLETAQLAESSSGRTGDQVDRVVYGVAKGCGVLEESANLFGHEDPPGAT